ncbi:tetratricopeptide repeat protein [Fulvivirga sp. M361]|uniref:tetratricopeptide repeat protein n=1 Tax=Fulvivirga sp. M361 TaxID=2594266 RepID=UPI001179BC15|nr:tetratricopeptide repeat protein [Fulvivirga sp. M361]TRX60789.1 tetratricopeptide repeat protein [Fulvivirga sp. M361]
MGRKRIIFWLLYLSITPALQAQVGRSATDAYQAGVEALDQMDYAMALEKFDEVLFHQPDLADGYFRRAAAKVGLKAYERALTDYTILLELEPNHHEGLYARALLQYQLKKYTAAREDLVYLRSLPGGETNTIFFAQPRYGNGVTGVHTVQGTNPAYIYNYLGLIDKELGKYDQALTYFDSAVTYAPGKVDHYLNRGLTYQEKGELALAEKDYLKVLSLDNEHGLAKYNLAVLMQQKGESKEAEDYFTLAIEANPKSPYPYRQRGYRRIKEGNFKGALADLDSALFLNNSDVETWLNKGIALAKLKLWQEAVKSYSQAIDLAPDFEKVYLNRGNTLYQLELYEEALEDYEAALRLSPAYGMALYHRGLVFHKLADNEKACADLRMAVQGGIIQAQRALKKICRDEL